MNKTIHKTVAATLAATGLMLVSASSWAEPYLGLGYQAGLNRIEDKDLRDPVVDGQAIDSDDSWKGSPKVLAGYRLNDNWALEFTYSRGGIEDNFEQRIDATQDEEWESQLDANHFTVAPVYLHPLNNFATLRFTAGAVYGDYTLKQQHGIDVDDAPDVSLSRTKSSDTAWGGLVGVGAAFHLPWKIDLVTGLQYQRTRLLSEASASVTAVYRF